MHDIFLLIYRQPLHRIIICMLFLSLLWGYLAFREKNSLRWRLGNAAIFVGMVAVIFYMTVYTRPEGTSEAMFVPIPFQSFREAQIQPELYRSMLMNVFLFVPVGLSLPFVVGKGRVSVFLTVVVALFFSAGIEYMQYRYALGRCEVDDIIMNTMGTLIGCLGYWLFCNWERIVLPGLLLLAEMIRQVVKIIQNS